MKIMGLREGGAGDGLLSRDLSVGVPSALQGLTIVFGMGTSVAPALQSPAMLGSRARGAMIGHRRTMSGEVIGMRIKHPFHVDRKCSAVRVRTMCYIRRTLQME